MTPDQGIKPVEIERFNKGKVELPLGKARVINGAFGLAYERVKRPKRTHGSTRTLVLVTPASTSLRVEKVNRDLTPSLNPKERPFLKTNIVPALKVKRIILGDND